MGVNYNEKLREAGHAEGVERNYIKAKSIYEELIAQYPDRFDAYYFMGVLEANLGSINDAIKFMKIALDYTPLYEGYKKLSEFHIIAGDATNALKYLKLALIYNSNCEESKMRHAKISPNNPQVVRPTPTKIVGSYKRSADCPHCQYKQLYSEEVIKRKSPKIIKEFLTENQLIMLEKALALNETNHCKESFVIKVPEGRAYVKQSEQTYIITQDNKYLEDMLVEGAPLDNLENLPNEVRAADKMLVLSSAWGGNFYHWLTWTVPRLAMIEKAGYKLNDFDKIVVNYVGFKFQRELLQMLGIPLYKIIASLPYGAVLRAKTLVTASLPSHLHTPLNVTDSLREKFLKPKYIKETSPKRIYLSRNAGLSRIVLNEEELTNYLQKYGFVTVYAENLSFEEQVAIFANADIVVAPHGAGLLNLTYSKSGTKVVEIYNETLREFLDTGFFRICSNVGLDHYFMFGEPVDGLNKDMIIDLQKLAAYFELAEIKPIQTIASVV